MRQDTASQLYEADYDAGARYLRIRLSGTWDMVAVASFAREMTALRYRVADAGHRDDRGRILLDLSDYPLQSPLVGAALGDLLPQLGSRAGRVAVVHSPSMLQRQQLRRLLTLDKVRLFDTLAGAQVWLAQSVSPPSSIAAR